jgi:hypothetical protein
MLHAYTGKTAPGLSRSSRCRCRHRSHKRVRSHRCPPATE